MTTHADALAAEKNKKKMCSKLYHVDEAVASMEYDDEEQRARKGKSKIVCEEDEEKNEEKGFSDLFPRKKRSALRFPQRSFENLEWASTSSVPLPLFLHSEKTETQNPPSPNSQSSLSENTSQPESFPSKTDSIKKAKVGWRRLWLSARVTLAQLMRDMNGAEDPTLIFEKTLFVADVNPTQSRFSMPFKSLIRNDFLTPLECRILEEDVNYDHKVGLGAILVDQRSRKWGVTLKKWKIGNRSWSYSLTCGWNDVVEANGLKEGDYIRIWSFRCRQVLCFALLTTGQSTSSVPL